MVGANTNSEQREDFSTARQIFNTMTQFLESDGARQMRHDELEGYVVNKGCELQRQMLQEHMNLRGEMERPLRVVDSHGAQRVERRHGSRRLMSLVGEVRVPRLLYQLEGGTALSPQDAALNLPVEIYSLGVRRRVAEEVASASFEHAVERLSATTGAEVAKRQVEELAQRAAADFESYYALGREEPPEKSDKLLVLTFDGAAIVMRTEDLRPATRKAAERDKSNPRKPSKRIKKGEKRNRKRVVQVTAVYEVDPYIRNAKDILRELRPVQDTTPSKPRPRPVHKRVRASVTNNAADEIDAAFQEAFRRDPQRQQRWVVLVDGLENQLELVRATAKKYEVDITILLDVMHVLEYLWKASYGFHNEGTKEAEQWVTKRLRMLLEGVDPSHVAAGIRRSATLQALDKREAVDTCANYLLKNRNYLRYAPALADGLPIATGVIEGACRYIVRDRMDKTGARWSLKGAEAVLRLRALRANGDFDAYWNYHTLQEYNRNHASHYFDGQVPNPMPSRPRLTRVK